MKTAAVFLLCCILLTGPLPAADERGGRLLETARQALIGKDRIKAQFYLSQHLARTSFTISPEVDGLLKEMRLEPRGFIPSSWPEPVYQWFIERSRAMWPKDISRVHEKEKRIEIATASQGDYFATLTIVPEVQAWYRTENGISTTRELLVAGAGKPAPILAFGRHSAGSGKSNPSALLEIFTLRALHHAHLSFKDFDSDGKPEVVAHLTWLVSNSFRQTARIYRILGNNQLELWKTQDAPAGELLYLDANGQPQSIEIAKVTESTSPYLET